MSLQSSALFYVHGHVRNLVLFPLAVFLGAAAAMVLRTGAPARWLGWIGLAFGLVVGALATGSIAGLDIGPADQWSSCWWRPGWQHWRSASAGHGRRRPGGSTKPWTE